MIFLDPSGNAVEIKCYRDESRIFDRILDRILDPA
jgi:extradiol dioxygenase family protein